MSTITTSPAWSSADLGEPLLPVAELMVDLAAVTEGQLVLAAAAGNAALAKAVAHAGAGVVSSESVSFGWPDGSFDAVLGFFSLTSYRDPRAVAIELKRVVRSGSPIVLVTWSEQPWANSETASAHFAGYQDLAVTDHTLAESGMAYSLVFARKP